MDARLAEILSVGARDRLMADASRIDESRGADRAEGADDSVVVFTLDGNQIAGSDEDAVFDRADNDGSGGGGWGDSGGYDDGAHRRAPQPELSDERRDRVIVMMVGALAAGTALLIGGIMLAGALGWIQPACGAVLVTHTATCRSASGLYTTLKPAITPDWSRYRLDAPAGQQQPTP